MNPVVPSVPPRNFTNSANRKVSAFAVEYDAERGKCVIDFRARPGHEMDVEAAARLLERLAEDDIRVQAMADP